jgi:O-antigen ligase
VPMTLLMVAQFRAPPDAFLNRTAGGGGEMMMSALGKVRTAGPFSFVVGVVAYYALATAYLIWAVLRKDVYKNWLLIAAGAALVIGISVSGSRSVVGACAMVVTSLLLVIFLRPDVVNRFGRALLVALILGFIVSRTPIFREGVNVLSARFSEVAGATDQSMTRGLIVRAFAVFGEGFSVLDKAPMFGYGLGVGTNAGAKFLTGHSVFLLTEGEWSRIFLESGPLLGLAYLVWRCAIVAWVGWLCAKSVKLGNLLPLLLFSASFLPMVSGQFGQPTILGFAVFVTGLALAARNEETSATSSAITAPPARLKSAERIVRRRSVYAARLHGPSAEHGQNNGSVGR